MAAQVAPDPDGGGLLPGPETVYYYSRTSQLDAVIDPLGRRTEYEYDVRDQLVTLTEPDPATGLINSSSPRTHYKYNDAGDLISVEDPLGNFTTYTYSAYGHLATVNSVDGNGYSTIHQDVGRLVSNVYNPFGEMTSSTVTLDDDTTSTTEYEYDQLGRISKVYLPNPSTGTSSKTAAHPIFYAYEYDDGGRLISVQSPSKDGTSVGAFTQYDYDYRDRLVSVIASPDGSSTSETSYGYDNEYFNFATQTDPVGNVTQWNFDQFGRVASEDAQGYDPSTSGLVSFGTRSYGYDPNGNLTELTDRNDRVTDYVYDALGRMTTEKWFDDDEAPYPNRTLNYEYDWVGNLTDTSDPAASYDFEYDQLDRQVSSKTTLPNLPNSVTLATQYDAAGNRTQLAASFKNLSTLAVTPDFVNNYVYDPLNRVTSISQAQQTGGNTVAFKQVGMIYNDSGQLQQINRFNQTVNVPDWPYTSAYEPDGLVAVSQYTYDKAARLTSIHSSILDSTTSTIDQSWTYDNLDRVTRYHNSEDTAFNSGNIDYDYDDLSQLIAADGDPSLTYEYDANGNRLATGYSMGAGNRLVDDGRYQYYYDNEGNLVRRYDTLELRDLTLGYDNRNRLVSITEVVDDVQTFDLSYDYDTFNRRVGRTQMTIVQGSEGHPTTVDYDYEKYVYDGDHVVLDFFRGYGGSYTLDHRYLYGPGTDQLLAQENLLFLGLATSVTDPARVFWPLTDNLGTVRDLVGADGSLIEHYRYDAFGNIKEGDSAFTRYLYTGREFDSATALQYNRNRWYDSVSGRWLSEDPLGFAAGDANLYRYVGNNPTNFRDPSGLSGESIHSAYTPPGGGAANGSSSGLQDWFNDPVQGKQNRDLWDKTWMLRIQGTEGGNSGPGSPRGSGSSGPSGSGPSGSGPSGSGPSGSGPSGPVQPDDYLAPPNTIPPRNPQGTPPPTGPKLSDILSQLPPSPQSSPSPRPPDTIKPWKPNIIYMKNGDGQPYTYSREGGLQKLDRDTWGGRPFSSDDLRQGRSWTGGYNTWIPPAPPYQGPITK